MNPAFEKTLRAFRMTKTRKHSMIAEAYYAALYRAGCTCAKDTSDIRKQQHEDNGARETLILHRGKIIFHLIVETWSPENPEPNILYYK